MTTKTFACIADAVAHFYRLGFSTTSELDDGRIMQNADGHCVRIRKVGFLTVEAVAA